MWGRDFLDGFAQLVDWHCFRGEIRTWSPLTALAKYGSRRVQVDYALVAGLDGDVDDALSELRLEHWREHVKLGNCFYISTFDGLHRQATEWCRSARAVTARP